MRPWDEEKQEQELGIVRWSCRGAVLELAAVGFGVMFSTLALRQGAEGVGRLLC